MIGGAIKAGLGWLAGRGAAAGAGAARVGAGDIVKSIGMRVSALTKSARAGYVTANALRGMTKGAVVGGALWGVTGNASWMPLMMGAGGWMGGARGLASSSAATKSFVGKHLSVRGSFGAGTKFAGSISPSRYGWLNPGMLARNMAIGTAVGVATDNPNWAIYGGLGIPAAKFVGKHMIWGGAKSGAKKIFTPSAMTAMEAVNLAGVAGMVGGAGYAGVKLATGWGQINDSVTSGYYPGGVMQLPSGGPGIGNNHLSTEGLTLALHKTARRTRVM